MLKTARIKAEEEEGNGGGDYRIRVEAEGQNILPKAKLRIERNNKR